jgi:hypothetical protein
MDIKEDIIGQNHDSTSIMRYAELGDCLRSIGDYTRAQQYYEKALYWVRWAGRMSAWCSCLQNNFWWCKAAFRHAGWCELCERYGMGMVSQQRVTIGRLILPEMPRAWHRKHDRTSGIVSDFMSDGVVWKSLTILSCIWTLPRWHIRYVSRLLYERWKIDRLEDGSIDVLTLTEATWCSELTEEVEHSLSHKNRSGVQRWVLIQLILIPARRTSWIIQESSGRTDKGGSQRKTDGRRIDF